MYSMYSGLLRVVIFKNKMTREKTCKKTTKKVNETEVRCGCWSCESHRPNQLVSRRDCAFISKSFTGLKKGGDKSIEDSLISQASPD